MYNTDYAPSPNIEFFHYGVKGMKWGVRKDRNKKNNSVVDDVKRRKEQYREIRTVVKKGSKKAAKIMTTMGTIYLIDDVFFDGAGSSATKEALNTIGRVVVKIRR